MSFRSPAYNASSRKVMLLIRRHQAQRKLQKAVARELIKKPTRCQRCRQPFPKPRLQGHHHRGYNNPLDVKWYCQACPASSTLPDFKPMQSTDSGSAWKASSGIRRLSAKKRGRESLFDLPVSACPRAVHLLRPPKRNLRGKRCQEPFPAACVPPHSRSVQKMVPSTFVSAIN
jgi:hypothetical protein